MENQHNWVDYNDFKDKRFNVVRCSDCFLFKAINKDNPESIYYSINHNEPSEWHYKTYHEAIKLLSLSCDELVIKNTLE